MRRLVLSPKQVFLAFERETRHQARQRDGRCIASRVVIVCGIIVIVRTIVVTQAYQEG